MRLEQSFEVNAPVEEVWATLIDVERVAPCLPGAEITGRDDDGTYHGDFKIKLGPTTAAYRGALRMESLDEDAHVVTMRAEGQDKRGQGSAKATMVSRMTEADGVTRVDVETDLAITGKLARFGRGGMIKDVSNKLLGEFADCLRSGFENADGASGTTAPAAPAADGPVPPDATEAGDRAPAPEVTEASGPDPTERTTGEPVDPGDELPAADPSGGEPTESAEDPAGADASADAGSQVPPTEVRATRGGAEGSARSPGERAGAAPSSEGPGGPDAPRADTGVGAPDSPASAETKGVASPAPSSTSPTSGGGASRFKAPPSSEPIRAAGLVGSVLLDRVAPLLLPLVRSLRRLLERAERALGGEG